MRQILVDPARSRQALKRGGRVQHLELREGASVSSGPRTDPIEMDDALKALAAVDLRKSRIVELRFFGGLSIKETAEVLNVSEETVQRDCKLAKNWLRREFYAGV